MEGLIQEVGLYGEAPEALFLCETARLSEPDRLIRLGLQGGWLGGAAV